MAGDGFLLPSGEHAVTGNGYCGGQHTGGCGAYAAFANGGMLVTPYLIESVKAPDGRILWQYMPPRRSDRVLSERSATLMAAMLEKAIREGTGASVHSAYGVKVPLAGKTGTSQNYADARFAAFNPAMVIVSRVGASTPSIHFNSGSYGSGSARPCRWWL